MKTKKIILRVSEDLQVYDGETIEIHLDRNGEPLALYANGDEVLFESEEEREEDDD